MAKAPKFAVLAHASPQFNKGGAELSASMLYRGLQELGHDAVMINMVPHGHSWAVWSHDPNEIFIRYDPSLYDFFYHIAAGDVQDKILEAITVLGCDVVYAHHFLFIGVNTLRCLKERGIRVVLTLHEFLAICNNHGQMVTHPALQLCYEAKPFKCASCFPAIRASQFVARETWFKELIDAIDLCVSPSDFLKHRFVEWGVAADEIAVIENGTSWHPATDIANARESETFVFGYFGQINRFKGVDTIIAAGRRIMAQNDADGRIRIRIHGNLVDQSPGFRKEFDEACEHGTIIENVGPYDHGDVLRLMGACDYVVVPSHWWENSPLVIQEAFAARRPLIVSDIGGMAEKVLDGVNGLHFACKDSDDLAAKMRLACSRPLHGELMSNLPFPSTSAEMASKYLRAAGRG